MVRRGAALLILALSFGCASQAAPAPDGLRVDAASATRFDATFTSHARWARIEVQYTATTTSYVLTTSLGTTLAYQGTAAADAAFTPDPRMDGGDGFVVLVENDAEYPLVKGMLDELMAQGVSATPSPTEKATPRYGAAYTLAEVLGLVMLPQPDYFVTFHASGRRDGTGGMRDPDGYNRVWPAPGYDDPAALPAELRISGGSCCGPLNCAGTLAGVGECEDWCAAGDHCAEHHSSRGCGAMRPSASLCAHQNSAYLQSYGGPARYCSRHQQALR